MARYIFALVLALASVYGNVGFAKKKAEFDFAKSEIVPINSNNFQSVITRNRSGEKVSAVVVFRQRNSEFLTYMNDVIAPLAKELKGMVTIGAVDCEANSSFCATEFRNDIEALSVVVYPPIPLPVQVLKQGSPLKEKMLRYIPSGNVKKLTDETIEAFFSTDSAIPKVLVFTKSDSVPVLYKALSNEFKDRIVFGLVGSSQTKIASKYSVKKRPHILLFRANRAKPEIYGGDWSYTAIHSWINIYAETFGKGGGFSSNTPPSDGPAKPWKHEKVPELTNLSQSDLCFKKDLLCVIYLTSGKISSEELSWLEKLSENYSPNHPRKLSFRFTWIDVTEEPDFKKFLTEDDQKLPTAVIVKAKKKVRFTGLRPDEVATPEAIAELIENVESATSRFKNISGSKFPSFSKKASSASNSQKHDDL